MIFVAGRQDVTVMGVHECRRVGEVRSRKPSLEVANRVEPVTLHTLAQAANQRSNVLWAIFQQGRRRHDRIGPDH